MGDRPRILLVEDEYMIAHDMADGLRALGADVVGPVPSLAKALDMIEQESDLDGAVLDINLDGQKVFPAADRLLERNVPILFTTGYDEATIPAKYANVHLCEKPVTSGRLKKAVAELWDLTSGR